MAEHTNIEIMSTVIMLLKIEQWSILATRLLTEYLLSTQVTDTTVFLVNFRRQEKEMLMYPGP